MTAPQPSPLRFWAAASEVAWRPAPGPVVFLTIPEARETSLHALDAAENARLADDAAGFEGAIKLFHEINDACRNAIRWRAVAQVNA